MSPKFGLTHYRPAGQGANHGPILPGSMTSSGPADISAGTAGMGAGRTARHPFARLRRVDQPLATWGARPPSPTATTITRLPIASTTAAVPNPPPTPAPIP